MLLQLHRLDGDARDRTWNRDDGVPHDQTQSALHTSCIVPVSAHSGPQLPAHRHKRTQHAVREEAVAHRP